MPPVAPVPPSPQKQQKRFTSVRVPSVLPLHQLRQGMMLGTSTIKRAAVRFRGQSGKHLLVLALPVLMWWTAPAPGDESP